MLKNELDDIHTILSLQSAHSVLNLFTPIGVITANLVESEEAN